MSPAETPEVPQAPDVASRRAESGFGLVTVVGTGLIGASVGLALRAAGVPVALEDPSPTAVTLAADLGAGRLARPDDRPDVVVVAAPPDVTARVVGDALRRHPGATVTDVASVKRAVEAEVVAAADDPARYVGSHPMAGRERSGAIAARSDLFAGRPWVVVAHEASDPGRVAQVERLAALTGAAVARMASAEHDAAVAAVSHVPQVAASLVAARLRDLPADSVALAGQGLRDVTRIAASDPALWTQILVGNASAVRTVLADLAADLGQVVAALADVGDDPDAPAPGARRVLASAIAHGNAGHARIPGKHGAGPTTYGTVTVLMPDRPGHLALLFDHVGAAGVNVEDVRIEHEVGRAVGVVEIAVLPAAVDPLRTALRAQGWTVRD